MNNKMPRAGAKANYTPGPWRIDEGRSIVAQFEGEEVQIAAMNRSQWSQPDGGKNHRLSVQTPANARLIASAPALLEALENLVSVCEGTGRQPPCIENAKAAISAAKGE